MERQKTDTRRDQRLILSGLNKALSGLYHSSRNRLGMEINADERKQFGVLLWKVLPADVVSVDLLKGVIINRRPKEIAQIPEERRKNWNLMDVDLYAAKIADELKIKTHKRRFPPL